jgi:hypothetical protein
MTENDLQVLYDVLSRKLASEKTVPNFVRTIRAEPCILGGGQAPGIVMEASQPAFLTIQVYYPLSERQYTRAVMCGGLVRFNLANLYNNRTRLLYCAADRIDDVMFLYSQLDLPMPPGDMTQAYMLLYKYTDMAGQQMGLNFEGLDEMT